MRKLGPLAFILLLWCAVISLAPELQAEAPLKLPIKIGIIAPLTGDLAPFGNKAIEGVKLALDQFDSREISVVIDDVGSETSARVATATTKLISVDKVNLILGLVFVDQTMIAAPVAQKYGVPFFAAALCSNRFKEFKQFACGYSSTEEQLASIEPLLRKLGVKRLATFVENSDFAQEADEVMRKQIAGTGIEIVRSEKINPGERDFRSLIPKFEGAKPDGIFAVTADPSQSFLLFKQLSERKFSGKRIGYLDIDPKYIVEFGRTIEGVYLPGFISQDYSPDFVERFKAKYHREPDMYGALAYDQLRIMAKALTDSDRLPDTDPYRMVIGFKYRDPAVRGYSYRPDGTVSLPLTIYVVKDGKFVPEQ